MRTQIAKFHTTSTVFSRHLWYISEVLVPLNPFNEEIPVGWKRDMVAARAVFVSTSVTVRERLVCRKQFIDVMRDDKYLNNFGRQNILDIFWTTLLVSIGLLIGQDLTNIRVLHL